MNNNSPDTAPDSVRASVSDPIEREALDAVWRALAEAKPARYVDADASAAMLSVITAATTARARRRPSPLFGLAAAAALVMAVGFSARPGAWTTVTVPLADRAQITLPDGSEVDLDAGTTLRYRQDFRGWGWGAGARVRTVALEGSAFFKVVSAAQPFEVHSYNAVVRVLGTEFSVDARKDDQAGTMVAVAEGRVSVRGSGEADATVALTPGERSVVADAQETATAASSISVDRVAPWRTGGLVVIDEPLRQFVRAVERRYGVSITLPADRSVGERRATFYYPTAVPIERVLSDLATTQQLRWSRQADGYVFE